MTNPSTIWLTEDDSAHLGHLTAIVQRARLWPLDVSAADGRALAYVPRKVDDDCLIERRWFYDRRDITEVRRDIAPWVAKWQVKYPKLVSWVEENVEEALTYYPLPFAHHEYMKSTNVLARLNQELKRRTLVVRIFPNPASCLRLTRVLAIETHEGWFEASRHLNMEHRRERKREALRALAA